jgi:hypothetical protein
MFIKALRGLFAWALEAGHVKSNPCDGVKVVAVATDGFAPWTDDDVAAYRARWPLGTHQRVAFEVLRETGLRRGDAVRVGRAHVRDGVIRLATEKTGERVAIAVSETLASAIEAGPVGDLTFIVGAGGKPLVKEAFTNMFRKWALAAKVNKSPHGIRKTAATADALDGWNDAELSAKFGWTGRQMASLYTRSASRERLSLGAAARVKAGTKVPHPDPKVRAEPQGKSGDFEDSGAPSRGSTRDEPGISIGQAGFRKIGCYRSSRKRESDDRESHPAALRGEPKPSESRVYGQTREAVSRVEFALESRSHASRTLGRVGDRGTWASALRCGGQAMARAGVVTAVRDREVRVAPGSCGRQHSVVRVLRLIIRDLDNF